MFKLVGNINIEISLLVIVTINVEKIEAIIFPKVCLL